MLDSQGGAHVLHHESMNGPGCTRRPAQRQQGLQTRPLLVGKVITMHTLRIPGFADTP